ncbi:MAG: transporter ATP-binding protein [Panacagrimonas sp.]|nr:ABC transporter ATP-binding protein [Panacagrimonas sp.]MCC2658313.1 transporter ATP-binding protein [Panacagrimonas sp.]
MRPKITLQGVSKAYGNGEALPVVDALDLSIREGEILAVVGPSGCGKTTLLNIMAGFVAPDSGEVRVDERPVVPDKKGILMSQQGSVFPWLTVRQNLMFGLNGAHGGDAVATADQYASLVGLRGFETAYPYQLSGGMLKRVEFARALAVKPEILYMDEPFSALDAQMSLRIRNELLNILQTVRKTVVLVTHDVEEAVHMADRVAVLTARPTRIQTVFEVDLPRPRAVASTGVQALRAAILRELGVD